MSLERQGPGSEGPGSGHGTFAPSPFSVPGSGLGKHCSEPTWLLPCLGMHAVNPGQPQLPGPS